MKPNPEYTLTLLHSGFISLGVNTIMRPLYKLLYQIHETSICNTTELNHLPCDARRRRCAPQAHLFTRESNTFFVRVKISLLQVFIWVTSGLNFQLGLKRYTLAITWYDTSFCYKPPARESAERLYLCAVHIHYKLIRVPQLTQVQCSVLLLVLVKKYSTLTIELCSNSYCRTRTRTFCCTRILKPASYWTYLSTCSLHCY